MSTNEAVRQIYDRLWAETIERFAAGEVQLDRYLSRRDADRRTGITLIARPDPNTIARFSGLVSDLKALEPDQYFYRPEELHVTVMTLVTGSETFDLQKAPIAAYRSVFAGLFERIHRFCITFRGITASAGAILVQGYAEDDYLNKIRDMIRSELQRTGLAENLDVRYKIATAHSTIMRFRSQPRDIQKLIARLHAARDYDFGGTTVDRVDFVFNDWYMSHDRVEVLAIYHLH